LSRATPFRIRSGAGLLRAWTQAQHKTHKQQLHAVWCRRRSPSSRDQTSLRPYDTSRDPSRPVTGQHQSPPPAKACGSKAHRQPCMHNPVPVLRSCTLSAMASCTHSLCGPSLLSSLGVDHEMPPACASTTHTGASSAAHAPSPAAHAPPPPLLPVPVPAVLLAHARSGTEWRSPAALGAHVNLPRVPSSLPRPDGR